MIKILVVDDMSQWRNFHKNALSVVLKDRDFDLTVKSSATEAREDIQKNSSTQYDLIITDLQMELDYEPDHAGEWLVKEVQKLSGYKNTKIIIVSAAYNIKIIAQNSKVDCIAKPTLINNLLVYELKIKEALNC